MKLRGPASGLLAVSSGGLAYTRRDRNTIVLIDSPRRRYPQPARRPCSMAFWVVGGGTGGTPLHDNGAARRSGAGGDEEYFNLQDRSTSCHWHDGGNMHAHYDHECDVPMEQPQPQPQHQQRHHHHHHHRHAESVPIRNLAFLVIREGSGHGHIHDHGHDHSHDHSHDHIHNFNQTNGYHHTPSPSPSPSPKPYLPSESPGIHSPHTNIPIPTVLERTESGHSISSDTSAHNHHHHHHHHSPLPSDTSLLEDVQAARLVRDHIALYRRRYPDSQPERILRALINPKSRGADFPLDNDALRSIFSAANELFFASRLTRRVTWDWSHSASEQYENHIVGTTALRRSARFGGWETLIVLSSPILRDTKYNRRLLISTFLHEMMHSFMFVTCGLKAKECGGHTKGFHQIAGIIDDWAGKDCLHLRDMEADLARWRGNDFPPASCGAGAGAGGDASNHDSTDNHGSTEHHLEFSKYDDPLHLEQVTGSWDKRHISSKHEPHLLRPSIPQRHASQEEWQWYEREDFGERQKYVA